MDEEPQGYIKQPLIYYDIPKISGISGIITTVVGIALLGLTFITAMNVFQSYYPFKPSPDLTSTLNLLLGAAIQAMFLGVMGWVGSILLVRGVDFMKVDKGVGVVTFKVEKGVGIVTNVEDERKQVS